MLRYISIYWTLIPIVTGLINFRKLNFECRLILYLLIYGFFTDMLVGNSNLYEPIRFVIFNLYPLVESIVLTLVVICATSSARLKSIGKFLLVLIPLFWLISHKEIFSPAESTKKFSPVFDAIYYMIMSILFGYLTIKLAEKTEQLFAKGMFWLLLSIFLNCFCIYFFRTLLETSFVKEIWFILSLLNIMVYSMFAVAFVMQTREARPNPAGN